MDEPRSGSGPHLVASRGFLLLERSIALAPTAEPFAPSALLAAIASLGIGTSVT